MNELILSYRQGDLFLYGVPTIPEQAQVTAEGPSVLLLEGENGHHHTLEGEGFKLLTAMAEEHDEYYDTILPTEQQYLEVSEPVALVHHEHRPIEIDPGFYQIVQQFEYAPRLRHEPARGD